MSSVDAVDYYLGAGQWPDMPTSYRVASTTAWSPYISLLTSTSHPTSLLTSSHPTTPPPLLLTPPHSPPFPPQSSESLYFTTPPAQRSVP